MRRARHHGQSLFACHPEAGFILPLTLWIVALFGLAIAAINTWVGQTVENARVLQQKADDEQAIADIKNELVFAIGTRPMTFRGMEVGADLVRPDASDINAVMSGSFTSSAYVNLDGRPYVVASNPDYVVQIQDTRGLVNLNAITAPNLRRLLAYYGAPEELRNQLPDTLADWIDEDDLTHLSGAEKPDYERRNRLPPPNLSLLTPMEAQSILGWDQIPQIWEADLRSPVFTSCGISGFNPNTASEASLLTYVPGMTPAVAAQVISERKQSALRSARDLMARTGVLIPNEAFFFSMTAGMCFIVDITNRISTDRVRLSLSLIQTSMNQPWQVDYDLNIPSQYRQRLEGLDPQVAFPTPEEIYPIEPGRQRDSGVR